MSQLDRLAHAAGARLDRVHKDAGLAVVVGMLQLAITLPMAHGQEGRESIDALAIGLLLAGPSTLAWMSRAPVAVLWLSLAPVAAYWALDYPRGPVFLAAIVAFTYAVAEGHRIAAWAALVAGSASMLYLPSLVGDAAVPAPEKALGILAWVFFLATMAEVIRVKREHHREEERAQHERLQAVAGEERLRIARELHDVLAHNVSLINVQAGTALHLLDERPEHARPALEAIKVASADTLREMRSVLSIMRRPGESPPREPTAGIAGLGDLVARTNAAGIPVETTIAGEPRPAPASVELAVYRIVQEALTNVARHANPPAARVRLAYDERALTVEVDDDGRDAHAVNGTVGNGIAGMRERVAALGGEFEAGPRGEHGFRVRAALPLGATR